MNALDYSKAKIRFAKTSDITGRFEIEKYRFLEAPLKDLSNPRIRRMVVYKASSCMGTVFAQCAMAYRIERELGDIQFVAQTDSDAAEWTVTRGKEFILRLPSIDALIPRADTGKIRAYAITNSLWQFAHKFALIAGPGVANQQSKQVRFLFTDESHLVESFPDGTLAAFEKRMGGKWNRAALHVTTAADKGREVDLMYHDGAQNEFHLRCLNCKQLFWPLWEDDAKDYYKKRLFVWDEKDNEQDTINTLRLVCPHCSHEHQDDMQTRFGLQTHGDYVAMNPDALVENQSYRWSCFCFYPMPWKERLSEWLAALRAEKLGDLAPMADFIKKRLCQSYVPTLHNVGESITNRDYKTGSFWIVNEPTIRTASFDVQDEGGFHLWAQCDEFIRDGSSRRIKYCKLSTWEHAKQFQTDHGVNNEQVAIDIGHRYAETLGRCAQWKWYGFQSTGDVEFMHKVFTPHHAEYRLIPNRFYSQCQLHNAGIGKSVEIVRGVPHELQCLVRKWSKQGVGKLLMRLKSGDSGRYFGIASDFSEDYMNQLHSYIEIPDVNKKYGTHSVTYIKQIRHHDHAFPTTCQSLILAMIAGYYPVN